MATGTIGTIASWSFSGVLSILATICTLIVVAPKAWEQIKEWDRQYRPRVLALIRRRR